MPSYDDVGSLPLPGNVKRKDFERSFVHLEEWALQVYKKSMRLKMDAGVQIPCYPQLRDMNDQFLDPLKDPELIEEPYLIYEDEAMLPEIEVLEKWNIDLPKIKMCVTGPLELSVSEFGNRIHEDVLLNIAKSLNRFIENAESSNDVDIRVVSVDEPSLGTNPQLMFEPELLVEAWDIVGETATEVQIHIHSPLVLEDACKSNGIDIVDIVTAATPENIDLIDPEVLESYGKGIRAGISRTDILSMASEFNEKNKVNVWSDDEAWKNFLNEIESPFRIAGRIERVNEKFGGLIKYLGPDCGLGGAKKISLAEKILKNTKSGIETFRGKHN